jgi:hypothetical protein
LRKVPRFLFPLPDDLGANLLGAKTDPAWTNHAEQVLHEIRQQIEDQLRCPPMPKRLGPYVIQEPIDRGGMGSVFLGVHTTTGKTVAIKTALAGSPHGQALQREAVALGSLDHRGIVQIHDHGQEGGLVWLAMQLVRGRTLRTIIADRWWSDSQSSRRLDPVECRRWLGWFRDVAQALHAMHERQLVHRDVKPANLMIAQSGDPFLIDFGLTLDVSDNPLVDALAGTVPYMSPEQVLKTSAIDRRSDVYSLAASFFELFTARRLVRADERNAGILHEIAFGDVPRLTAFAPSAPPPLDPVFARALAKNPADRYATAALLADDLDRLAMGSGPIHVREGLRSRLWRHRFQIVATVIAVAAASWFGGRWLVRRHDLQALRELANTVSNAESAMRALHLARAMQVAYGDYQEFRDIYAKAVMSTAPTLTLAMFERGALLPAESATGTFAGQIGLLANQHLAAGLELGPQTRDELLVQAMFVRVLARDFTGALALESKFGGTQDERTKLLGAISELQDGHTERAKVVIAEIPDDYANLDSVRLCCRACLLLELTGKQDDDVHPSKVQLAHLEAALLTEYRRLDEGNQPRNLFAGLLALTQMELGKHHDATQVAEDRLSILDKSSPDPRERLPLEILAAAAGFRSLVAVGRTDPDYAAVMSRVVKRCREIAAVEPLWNDRFVSEIEKDNQERNPEDAERQKKRFRDTTADFLIALASGQNAPGMMTSMLMKLVRYSEGAWNDPKGWRTYLYYGGLAAEYYAKLAAKEHKTDLDLAKLIDKEEGMDTNRRIFWINAIRCASNKDLVGEVTGKDFDLCTHLHAAAVVSTKAPHDDIDAAETVAIVKVRGGNPELHERLLRHSDSLAQRTMALDKSDPELYSSLADLLEEIRVLIK